MFGAQLAISLTVGVLPAAVLLWFVRQFDRTRPVPRRAMYTTMALGAVAMAPAVLIETTEKAILGDAQLLGGRFVEAFLVVALTEEALKLLVVLLFPFRRAIFVEVIDGVVYTVAASLGLGVLENLAFVANDLRTALVRSVTAVPMHAVSAGIMGYFVGRARTSDTEVALPLCLVGLFFAVMVHGLYDWAVFNGDEWWGWESSGVVFVGALALAALVRHARQMDEAMLGRHSITGFLAGEWPRNVTDTIVPAPIEPQDPDAP